MLLLEIQRAKDTLSKDVTIPHHTLCERS